jgi:hypothetical protein
MAVLRLALAENEHEALKRLAESEYREPKAQASYILRRELERRGLLPDDRQPETAVPQGVQNGQQ